MDSATDPDLCRLIIFVVFTVDFLISVHRLCSSDSLTLSLF